MNFDDHDWEVGPPSGENLPGLSTAWKVAAGVAVGIVLGGALVYAVDRHVSQTALAGAVQSLEQTVRGAEPPAAGASRPPLPPPAERVAVLPLRDQPTLTPHAGPELAAEAARPARPADVDPEAERAHRAAQRAADRKERAWAQFYKKPPQCDDNPTKTTMVECANHYIRAKREFEETYAAGKR